MYRFYIKDNNGSREKCKDQFEVQINIFRLFINKVLPILSFLFQIYLCYNASGVGVWTIKIGIFLKKKF